MRHSIAPECMELWELIEVNEWDLHCRSHHVSSPSPSHNPSPNQCSSHPSSNCPTSSTNPLRTWIHSASQWKGWTVKKKKKKNQRTNKAESWVCYVQQYIHAGRCMPHIAFTHAPSSWKNSDTPFAHSLQIATRHPCMPLDSLHPPQGDHVKDRSTEGESRGESRLGALSGCRGKAAGGMVKWRQGRGKKGWWGKVR